MIKNKNINKLYIYNALINFSLVSNVLSIYLEKNGFSLLNIGILFSILSIGKVIFEIPTGFIADRFGNKFSLILALIIQDVALIILYLTNNFYAIGLAFILLSVGYTLTTGCYDTILVYVVKKSNSDQTNSLSSVNSVNRFIYYCSMGLAGIASGYLFEHNVHALFLLNIMTVLAGIFIVNSVNYDKKTEKVKLSKSSKIIIGHIIRNKVIFYLVLIEAGINFSMIPVDRFMVNYLYDTFSISVGIITTIRGLLMIIVSFVAIYLNKHLKIVSKDFTVRYLPLIMIIAFLIFAFASNVYLAILSNFAAMILFSVYAPHKYQVFHENIMDSYRTTIISLKSIITMGVGVLSQPIFGYFSDRMSIQDGTRYLIFFSLTFILVVTVVFRKLNLDNKEI